MAIIAESSKPSARTDLVFRRLADEWVVLDSTTDQLHVLNLTAALVWLACDGIRTPAEIAVEVMSDFETPPPADVVRADVDAALIDLGERGLLQ